MAEVKEEEVAGQLKVLLALFVAPQEKSVGRREALLGAPSEPADLESVNGMLSFLSINCF